MGDLVVGVDGFYVYWPARSDGYWDSHTMRKIADKIDELDKPWQDNINEYFEQHREGILSADQEEKTPVAVENGQRQNSVVL